MQRRLDGCLPARRLMIVPVGVFLFVFPLRFSLLSLFCVLFPSVSLFFCSVSLSLLCSLIPAHLLPLLAQDAVAKRAGCAPFFVVPSARYEFEHPEATGHDTSPFFSFWFVDGGAALPRLFDTATAERKRRSGGGMFGDGGAAAARVQRCEMVQSTSELATRHLVPTTKRLNNRRRKALHKKATAGAAGAAGTPRH